jgi:hypothetical protein
VVEISTAFLCFYGFDQFRGSFSELDPLKMGVRGKALGQAQQYFRKRSSKSLREGWMDGTRSSRKPFGANKSRHPDKSYVPLHPELAPGTLRALIRDSGLTVDEFLKLL